MEIVTDTSAILAVITDKPDRDRLLALTAGMSLTAPASLPWEVGNAFSSMLKMRRLMLAQAQNTLRLHQNIPVRLVEVSLAQALALAGRLNIYASDPVPQVSTSGATAERRRRPDTNVSQWLRRSAGDTR